MDEVQYNLIGLFLPFAHGGYDNHFSMHVCVSQAGRQASPTLQGFIVLVPSTLLHESEMGLYF